MRLNLSRVLESLALAESDVKSKQTHYLTESAKVKKGVVEGVHILGLVSVNGREYEAKAVQEAASKYEGVGVYLNHNMPDQSGHRQERQVENKFGFFKNVRFVESRGLVGDFWYNEEHAYARAFEWWAKNNPKQIGFSHDAIVEYNSIRTKVIQIAAVESVDLVAAPATTDGIFEGVIADKMAADQAARKLSDTVYAAYALISNIQYGMTDATSDAEKSKAMLPIVRDLASELRSLSAETAQESITPKEEPMDYSKLTLEDLKKNCPQIVTEAIAAYVANEASIAAKVTEAVKDVPEALCSQVFLATVRESIDNAAKVKALVDDRKSIVVKAEVTTPAPKADTVLEAVVKTPAKVDLDAEVLAAFSK